MMTSEVGIRRKVRHGDGQSAEDLKAVIDGLPEVEEGEAHGRGEPEKARKSTSSLAAP